MARQEPRPPEIPVRRKDDGGRINVDANAELAKAAHLIREFGYGHRYDELADAEAGSGLPGGTLIGAD